MYTEWTGICWEFKGNIPVSEQKSSKFLSSYIPKFQRSFLNQKYLKYPSSKIPKFPNSSFLQDYFTKSLNLPLEHTWSITQCTQMYPKYIWVYRKCTQN